MGLFSQNFNGSQIRFSTAVSEVVAVRSLLVVTVVSVSVIVTVFGTINLVSLVVTTETTKVVGRLVGVHGVSVVSLELTVVSIVLSFSLRFSLSLGFSLRFSLSFSLENSVVLAPVLVPVLVVSKGVRSVGTEGRVRSGVG